MGHYRSKFILEIVQLNIIYLRDRHRRYRPPIRYLIENFETLPTNQQAKDAFSLLQVILATSGWIFSDPLQPNYYFLVLV